MSISIIYNRRIRRTIHNFPTERYELCTQTELVVHSHFSPNSIRCFLHHSNIHIHTRTQILICVYSNTGGWCRCCCCRRRRCRHRPSPSSPQYAKHPTAWKMFHIVCFPYWNKWTMKSDGCRCATEIYVPVVSGWIWCWPMLARAAPKMTVIWANWIGCFRTDGLDWMWMELGRAKCSWRERRESSFYCSMTVFSKGNVKHWESKTFPPSNRSEVGWSCLEREKNHVRCAYI